jgi:hypothetical protein
MKTLVDTIEQAEEDATTQDLKKKLSVKMDASEKRLINTVKHS